MISNENNISKYNKYKYLSPNYHFTINGEVAEGILPDGTRFKIDKNKAELVSRYYFHLSNKGYIYALKNKNRPCNLRLHWLVLGYTSRPEYIVDHINRDKTDCRVKNLRLVTNQQNSMNRKLGASNKTGYRGVTSNNCKGVFFSKICINNKRISLITSEDPIVCAQAYNYASQLLFRDFCGYQNPVPEPSAWLKRLIDEKCSPYMTIADKATSLITA